MTPKKYISKGPAHLLKPLGCVALAVTITPLSFAEERAHDFDAAFTVGARHDSNVAVLELDASTDESDRATSAEAQAGYKFNPSSAAQLRGSVSISDTHYDEFSQFDLRTYRVSAGGHMEVAGSEFGVDVHDITAELDDERFLGIRQVSPYVARFVNKRIYIRGAYTYADKDFEQNGARSSDNQAIGADAYYFLDGADTYLAFGYKYNDESATDAQFDYSGHKVHAQVAHRMSVVGVSMKLKARARWETRDYDSITPGIGAARDDDRYRYDVSVELPFNEHLSATGSYQYADNRSNLASVDFDEQIFALELAARF